ncbi:MAG: hypothetical protein JEY97_06900 [Bacteroidales bacterium]|nr:hypothetical protein [Bacteroidales bacterium]
MSKPEKIVIIKAIAENIVAFADYAALKIKKITEVYPHFSKNDFTKFKTL